MALLREVVVPVGLASAGVLFVLVTAARQTTSGDRRYASRRPAAAVVVRHVIGTALGGFALLMAAMSVYCGTRGVALGACMVEPVRGAGLLLVIAVPGLLGIEALSRLRGR